MVILGYCLVICWFANLQANKKARKPIFPFFIYVISKIIAFLISWYQCVMSWSRNLPITWSYSSSTSSLLPPIKFLTGFSFQTFPSTFPIGFTSRFFLINITVSLHLTWLYLLLSSLVWLHQPNWMHRIAENPISHIGMNFYHLHLIDGTWSLLPPFLFIGNRSLMAVGLQKLSTNQLLVEVKVVVGQQRCIFTKATGLFKAVTR